MPSYVQCRKKLRMLSSFVSCDQCGCERFTITITAVLLFVDSIITYGSFGDMSFAKYSDTAIFPSLSFVVASSLFNTDSLTASLDFLMKLADGTSYVSINVCIFSVLISA